MICLKTQAGKFLLAIVVAVACLSTARAATYQRFYGTESLSSNLVQAICQDSRGYIWIATEYGLNRFDGVYFTQYYADGPEGLAANRVDKLLPDADGVYVMLYSGLQLYTPRRQPLPRRQPGGAWRAPAQPQGHIQDARRQRLAHKLRGGRVAGRPRDAHRQPRRVCQQPPGHAQGERG